MNEPRFMRVTSKQGRVYLINIESVMHVVDDSDGVNVFWSSRCGQEGSKYLCIRESIEDVKRMLDGTYICK